MCTAFYYIVLLYMLNLALTDEKLNVSFLTWCSFISTSITSKWAALQWLSCFLIPCTSNVSSHTILSMSWGALTVRVRLNAISVGYYPKSFLLVCWSFCILKIIEGKGCVFTYDAVGSYERVGYSAQGSGATLITPFLDNQLKSPSPLLLPSKVWFWNNFFLDNSFVPPPSLIWMNIDCCRMQLLHFQR